jgi:hypothetical protein
MASDDIGKLPKSVLQGLYTPEFLPEELRLNEFVYTDTSGEARQKIDRRKTESLKPQSFDPQKTPVPLTEAEAAEADIAIDATLGRIAKVRDRISATKEMINKGVLDTSSGKGAAEIQFDVKVKGKPFLRKAIRKLFGERRDTITYSMYLEALALKRRIENEQAEGYTSGEFFSEEKNIEED